MYITINPARAFNFLHLITILCFFDFTDSSIPKLTFKNNEQCINYLEKQQWGSCLPTITNERYVYKGITTATETETLTETVTKSETLTETVTKPVETTTSSNPTTSSTSTNVTNNNKICLFKNKFAVFASYGMSILFSLSGCDYIVNPDRSPLLSKHCIATTAAFSEFFANCASNVATECANNKPVIQSTSFVGLGTAYFFKTTGCAAFVENSEMCHKLANNGITYTVAVLSNLLAKE